MEKMSISSTEKESFEIPTEATEAFNVLKGATNILDLHGLGITFFAGEDDGMIQCDIRFAMHCDNDPQLVGKDPFFSIPLKCISMCR